MSTSSGAARWVLPHSVATLTNIWPGTTCRLFVEHRDEGRSLSDEQLPFPDGTAGSQWVPQCQRSTAAWRCFYQSTWSGTVSGLEGSPQGGGLRWLHPQCHLQSQGSLLSESLISYFTFEGDRDCNCFIGFESPFFKKKKSQSGHKHKPSLEGLRFQLMLIVLMLRQCLGNSCGLFMINFSTNFNIQLLRNVHVKLIIHSYGW